MLLVRSCFFSKDGCLAYFEKYKVVNSVDVFKLLKKKKNWIVRSMKELFASPSQPFSPFLFHVFNLFFSFQDDRNERERENNMDGETLIGLEKIKLVVGF